MRRITQMINSGSHSNILNFYLGPIIEEGLIIGVSIAALLILISIILAILNNTTNLFNDFNSAIFG